ncbi:MAG: NAD(P)-binding protein, partial [Thermoanaerobaculia bacterium]
MQRRRAERRGSRAKKVVIVGAGPGGLANAMLLAQAGFDVEVLEKQAHVG